MIAIRGEDNWQGLAINDRGHDGWDNSIVVDNEGNWHMVAIEPAQFNLANGAEYATNAYGTSFTIEVVPGGATNYEYATSIDITDDGIVGVSYYSSATEDLIYAERGAGEDGEWQAVTVDSEGDVGRYANLAFDTEGNPHIAYFAEGDAAVSGTIRYAWRDSDGEWQLEDVAEISNIVEGSRIGTARKITSIAFDSTGTLHLAYTNNEEIIYAVRAESAWTSQIVTTSEEEGAALGSLVEMAVDSNDQPHLVYYVLGANPVIMYATIAP